MHGPLGSWTLALIVGMLSVGGWFWMCSPEELRGLFQKLGQHHPAEDAQRSEAK